MEIFCYDLLLSEIWSEKGLGLGFLIHDSTIFSDVDERQIAHALEYASTRANKKNFQYICCLNSDKIPYNLFSNDFDIKSSVVLELKDSPENACLFGFRF